MTSTFFTSLSGRSANTTFNDMENTMMKKRQEENDFSKEQLLTPTISKENQQSDDESPLLLVRPHKLFPVQQDPKDELIRQVRSLLNKVTTINYTRLRKRWLNFMPTSTNSEQSQSPEKLTLTQLSQILNLLIQKSMDDTIYTSIYAGLMGYVISRTSTDVSSQIQRLICSQILQQLKKLTTDKELASFHQSVSLVDATRRKRVSLHRFIAELYLEKVVGVRYFCGRVSELIVVLKRSGNSSTSPVDIDETVECLGVLMTFAGKKLELEKKSWVEDVFACLQFRQAETPSMVSKRIQFMILDLIEMRKNGWSPHNKWWSPSVQMTEKNITRERTVSGPSSSSSSSSCYQPPMMRNKSRVRTLSEGGNYINEKSTATKKKSPGPNQQHQQQSRIFKQQQQQPNEEERLELREQEEQCSN